MTYTTDWTRGTILLKKRSYIKSSSLSRQLLRLTSQKRKVHKIIAAFLSFITLALLRSSKLLRLTLQLTP